MTKSFTRKIHIAETVRKWPYSKCKPLHGKLSHKKNERQWSWYGKKIPCTSKNNQVPSEQKNSVKHPWRHRLDADLCKDPSIPEWGWGQEGRAEIQGLAVTSLLHGSLRTATDGATMWHPDTKRTKQGLVRWFSWKKCLFYDPGFLYPGSLDGRKKLTSESWPPPNPACPLPEPPITHTQGDR